MAKIGKWGEGSSHGPDLNLQSATIAGDAAGDLTLAGIYPGDELLIVQDVAAAGANLVDEFEIVDEDTINNTGGTDTTGMLLLVIWSRSATGRTGYPTS